MRYNIRGSKVEVTDSIKNYVEEKLNRLNKYFESADEYTANVLVKVNGINQTIEVTIPIKKIILRAEETNQDLYKSIDLVADKLERQIRKNKTRMRKPSKEMYVVDFEVNSEEVVEGKIVKRKEIENKPMSEEEAILQMELLGHEFFIFNNSDINANSVIYKRKDGNYGILELK